MKHSPTLCRFLLLALLAGSATAQSVTMVRASTTGSPIYSHVGADPSCTAMVSGLQNQQVTWSTTGGTLVPGLSTTYGPQTEALTSASTGTFTMTATSVANPSLSAACVIQFNPAPVPVGGSGGPTKGPYPRLFVPASALTALRAKGVSSNPQYQNALFALGNSYFTSWPTTYGFTFSTWNGTACVGGTAPTADLSLDYLEVGAYWISMVSLFDNNATTRNTYGCAARDIFLYDIPYVTSGYIHCCGDRFGNGPLPLAWTFTAEAIMSGGYFSSSDLTTLRSFFAVFGQALVANYYGTGYAPSPTFAYSTLAEFDQSNIYSSSLVRGMGNNYTHMRVMSLVFLGLFFNDNSTDDPVLPTGSVLGVSPVAGGSGWTVGENFQITGGGAIGQCTAVSGGACTQTSVVTASTGYDNTHSPGPSNFPQTTTAVSGTGTGLTVYLNASNTCGAARDAMCADGSAGSMHAYWNYVDGSMLYLDYAALEDPNIVQSGYGFSSQPQCTTQWGSTMPCLGLDRGGEAVEGTSYGNATTRLRWAMNLIRNAGWDDASLWGKQVSLVDSSYWDLRLFGDLVSQPSRNAVSTEQSRYEFVTNGDSAVNYDYPNQHGVEANMLYADSLTGSTDRTNALEWMALNSAFGGMAGTIGGCTSQCGYMAVISNDYASDIATPMFMALPAGNPVTTNPPTDPTSTLPTDWYDPGTRHVVLRNTWTPGYTLFSMYSPDTQIDHEHQYDGGFTINSNGYWITKGRISFDGDYNGWMATGRYENVLNIINSTGSGVPFGNYPWGPGTSGGGQQWHANQAGLVPFSYSDSPTYYSTHLDETNAYNGGYSPFSSYNDVQSASRDLIYLRGVNHVVYYDRAAVGHSASVQLLPMETTGAVTFTGNRGKWNDRSGTQAAYFTSLLPAGAAVATQGLFTYFNTGAPNLNLQQGTTMQATCTSFYADGTSQNCLTFPDQEMGTLAQWTSSDPSIATVSSTGLITGVSPGTVVISTIYTNPGFDGSAFAFNVVSGASGGGVVSGTSGNNQTLDWQPSQYISVTPASPLSASYLSDLQWGASAYTPATTTLVQSSAGQGYDGALVGGSTLAMFMRTWTSSSTFTGTTYPASGATTQYVSDLSPNTSYGIAGAGTPSSATTDNAGVLAFSAAGTGNITVGSFIPPGISAVSGGIFSGIVIQ